MNIKQVLYSIRDWCNEKFIDTLEIKSITDVIPEEASSSNQLADKDFVGRTYAAKSEVPVENGTGTNSVQQKGTGASASGAYAVATGNQTTASGNWSHAEGYQSTASTEAAHSEGINTSASGIWSHAEGDRAKSSGKSSHAEGSQTTAAGEASHAEGAGTSTTATAKGAHAEGINTTASEKRAHAEGFGTTASGDSAHAEGYQTTAFGANSHSEGRSTYAGGGRSHVEGCGTVTGTGKEPTITEDTAKGIFAHAEGNGTLAEAASSHTEGKGTRATNEGEHAEGQYNISISGSTIHTVGIGTGTSAKKNAHTITRDGKHYIPGIGTYVGTETSLPSGQDLATIVNSKVNITDVPVEKGEGANSVQQKGTGAVASGSGSYAGGKNTIVSGENSHAEGKGNTVSSNYSHAEGTRCAVSANAAHAEGSDNTVNDDAISSHVGGNQSSTNAKFSFAHGNYATTGPGADSSFALGAGVKTSNVAEFSIGRYNKSNTNTRFSVGIGTAGSELGRKNAFEVMQNGNAYLVGLNSGGYNGTNAGETGVSTLQTVINNLLSGLQPATQPMIYDLDCINDSNQQYYYFPQDLLHKQIITIHGQYAPQSGTLHIENNTFTFYYWEPESAPEGAFSLNYTTGTISSSQETEIITGTSFKIGIDGNTNKLYLTWEYQ